MKRWIFYFSIATLISTADKVMSQSITAVDPLVKVLKYQNSLPESIPVAYVALGENATFQYVVRSGVNLKSLKVTYVPATNGQVKLAKCNIGYPGYVKLDQLAGRAPAPDRIRAEDKYYPDPIFDFAPPHIPASTNQPIWVSIPVNLEQAPGIYKGKLIFSWISRGRLLKTERPLSVKVYPVKIKNTRLLNSNWLFYENRMSPPFAKLKYMNRGQEVIPYSPKFWELMEVVAKNMQEYRQNVFYISPLRETIYGFSNGRFTFDFSNFDKLVSIFKRYGVAKYIEAGHIGGRDGAWDAPFVINHMEKDANGIFQMKNIAINDPRARTFHSQFFPALVRHLKAKGWYSTYFQHLIDEPTDADAASYQAVSKLVKTYAPDLKIIDALSTTNIAGSIDVWVPQLEFLAGHESFFKQRANKGEMVWLYTCWLPQGNFANRFIELPALKNRLLPWISYKYGIKGNLNWGYNYWVDSPAEKADRLDGNSIFPGGDSWLVYPKYNGLYPSIRQDLMRAGMFDHELMSMLGERNPAKATELVNKVIYNFDRYNMDITNFRSVRRQILEALTK